METVQGVNDIVRGAKLIRLESALDAVGREVQGLPLDEDAGCRLTATVTRLLVEVGSALPDSLLDELVGVVGPLPAEQMSSDEARLLAAQLQGWVEGLLPIVRFDSADGQESLEPAE